MVTFYHLFIVTLLSLFFTSTLTYGCETSFKYSTGRECSEKYFSNSYLFVDSYQSYNHYLTPSAIDYSFGKDGGDYYYLASNVSYKLTWTAQNGDQSCDGEQSFATTFDNPTLVIEQPKCSHSLGVVKYSGPNGIQLEDGTAVTFPLYAQAQDESLKLYFDDGKSELCQHNIKFYELSNKYPVFKLNNPTCGGAQGSVELDSVSKYSRADLYQLDGTKLTPSSSSVWSGLQNQDYYFMLESSECGIQKVPFTLVQNIPKFNVSYKTDACPTQVSASIGFVDDSLKSAFTINIDGQQVDPNNIALKSGKSYAIEFIGSVCTFTSTFNTPDILLDVNYTITPKTCLASTVDLVFNDLIKDLVVKDSMDQVISISGKSFEYSGDHFTLESSCYGKKNIIITRGNNAVPIYTLSNAPQFIGDIFSLTVSNYQSFESLKIINHLSQAIGHTNGVFNNLTTYNYVLEYTTSSCATIQSIPINFALDSNDQDFIEEISIISLANCQSKGKGLYTIKSSNLNYQEQTTFEFDNTQITLNTNINWYGFNQQVREFKFTPPSIKRNDFNVDVIVQTKPTCAYSEDGVIVVASSVPITRVVIKGFVHLPTKQSNSTHYIFINIPSGEFVMTISSTNGCKLDKNVLVNTDSSFVFTYTTTSVSDCSVSDGSIQVTDPSLYSELMINGKDLLTTNGELVSLASDLYLVSFTLTDESCFGAADVYIPTSVQATPVANVTKTPYCQQSSTGEVEFIVTGSNSQPMTIDSVTDIHSTIKYTNSHINQLLPGTYKYLIKSNYCSWQVDRVVPSRNIEFTSTLVNSYLAGSCSQRSFVNIISSEYVDIDLVQMYDGQGTKESDSLGASLFSYNGESQSSLNALIYYGEDTCVESIKISGVNVNSLKRPFPELTAVHECSASSNFSSYSIKAVSNPSAMPMRLSFTDPDSNGLWNVPILFNGNSISDPVTGCKLDVSWPSFIVDSCIRHTPNEEEPIEKKKKGVNLGLAIGLPVGLAVGIALIAVAGYIVYRKKKKSAAAKKTFSSKLSNLTKA